MPKERLMLLGKKKINQPNNKKTVQSILCGACSGYEHIYASLSSPLFLSLGCLHKYRTSIVGWFTKISEISWILLSSAAWNLCGTQMDGWSREEIKVNLLFLMEELLPCRAGRPGSKTQDKTGLLKWWGGLSNSISCWIWFYSAAWCWQIHLFLGAFYPLPKIEVGRSLPVAAFL